ncbi:MAG: serine protease [Rubripirellula sp.]|nr:serine protease [Rubripirellula sp.]
MSPLCKDQFSPLLNVLVWFVSFVGMSNVGLAQIQLDRFFPPAVQIGQVSVVKVEGKFPNWPATIVCENAGLKIAAGEDSGVLEITVPDETPPGIAWIRVHDEQSASDLLPLFIEREPVQAESEPNNRLAESNQADLPALIAGRLEKSGDLDSYSVELKAGQTLLASLRANQILASPMDSILQLVDPRGNVVAQSDDVRGLDPQFVYQAKSDATFHVRVFAFPETPTGTIGFAGNPSYTYLLRLTTEPFLDHVLPLLIAEDFTQKSLTTGWGLPSKPSTIQWSGKNPVISSLGEASGWHWHDRAPANAVSYLESEEQDVVIASGLPVVFSGRLSQAGETDRLRFSVKSGQRYRASVYARRFGFELDSVLRLIDPTSGKELGRNDDLARNEYDAVLEYKAASDGEVELQISDLVDNHGARAVYSVLVQPITPKIELTVAAGRFPLTADKPAEIAVSVKRTGGDTSNVRLVPRGLPNGVSGLEVVSKAKGDSAKSVKLTLSCEAGIAVQGEFQIVGQRLDQDDKPVGEPILATYQLAKLFARSGIWLSVTEK